MFTPDTGVRCRIHMFQLIGDSASVYVSASANAQPKTMYVLLTSVFFLYLLVAKLSSSHGTEPACWLNSVRVFPVRISTGTAIALTKLPISSGPPGEIRRGILKSTSAASVYIPSKSSLTNHPTVISSYNSDWEGIPDRSRNTHFILIIPRRRGKGYSGERVGSYT
jgi:hypothetical protein